MDGAGYVAYSDVDDYLVGENLVETAAASPVVDLFMFNDASNIASFCSNYLVSNNSGLTSLTFSTSLDVGAVDDIANFAAAV